MASATRKSTLATTAWGRFCRTVAQATKGEIDLAVPAVIKGFTFYDTPNLGKVCVLRMVRNSNRVKRMYSCDDQIFLDANTEAFEYTFEGQRGDQDYDKFKRVIERYRDKLYLYTFDARTKTYAWKGSLMLLYHGSREIQDAEGETRKAFYLSLVPKLA